MIERVRVVGGGTLGGWVGAGKASTVAFDVDEAGVVLAEHALHHLHHGMVEEVACPCRAMRKSVWQG